MDTILKTRMAPSLALLTLAALTPSTHEIQLVDENVEALRFDDSPDLVAVTVNVDTAVRAYAIAARYRSRGVPVVGGGIHVSAVPQEAGKYFDAICIGPAEPVWATVLEERAAHSLRPVYRSEESLRGSAIPVPDRSLVRPGHYLYSNVVSTSRGCPFECSFCYNSCEYVDHAVINRPIGDVITEIRGLGTRHVMFIDDNFIGQPSWTVEFLQALRTLKLDLRWSAAVSTNIVKMPDLLDLMAATGCRSLFIGFETINAQANRGVGKRHNRVETYEALIGALHERGIMVNASLVFGLDHDDADVFRRTLGWLVANKVETMTAHILTPYPGTDLHQKLRADGRIVDSHYEHYNTAHVVFAPALMSKEELEKGYLWIYKELYSWRNIVRRLPTARSQVIPYLLFNVLYRKYGRLTATCASLGLLSSVGRLARRLSYNVE